MVDGSGLVAALGLGVLVLGCESFAEGLGGGSTGAGPTGASTLSTTTAMTTATAASGGTSGPSGTSAPSAPGTSDPPPNDTSSDDGPDQTSTTSAGTTSATTATTTTGAIDCRSDTYAIMIRVDDPEASVDAPMQLAAAWGGLAGDPQVAYSTTSEQGIVHFDVDLPCAGDHLIWGLGWDLYAGGSPCGATHADSLWFSVDDEGTEIFFAYGCDGCGGEDGVWFWDLVEAYQGPTCGDIDPYPVNLTAGQHELHFRNREPGTFNLPNPDVAGFAAIVVTNDPAYDPATEFPP